MGAEHVGLEHAGDQTLSATHLHGIAPSGWIVEKTFAWLSQSRRLGKGYEITDRQAFKKIRKRSEFRGTKTAFAPYVLGLHAINKGAKTILAPISTPVNRHSRNRESV